MNRKITNYWVAILNLVNLVTAIIFYFTRRYVLTYTMGTQEKVVSVFDLTTVNIIMNNIMIAIMLPCLVIAGINLLAFSQNRSRKRISKSFLIFAILFLLIGAVFEVLTLLGELTFVKIVFFVLLLAAIIPNIVILKDYRKQPEEKRLYLKSWSNIIVYYIFYTIVSIVLLIGWGYLIFQTKACVEEWGQQVDDLAIQIVTLGDKAENSESKNLNDGNAKVQEDDSKSDKVENSESKNLNDGNAKVQEDDSKSDKVENSKSKNDKLIPVRNDEKYGYISESGEEAISCQYDMATFFMNVTLAEKQYAIALVEKDGQDYILLNTNKTNTDVANADETNVDETNADETNVDETNADETNVVETVAGDSKEEKLITDDSSETGLKSANMKFEKIKIENATFLNTMEEKCIEQYKSAYEIDEEKQTGDVSAFSYALEAFLKVRNIPLELQSIDYISGGESITFEEEKTTTANTSEKETTVLAYKGDGYKITLEEEKQLIEKITSSEAYYSYYTNIAENMNKTFNIKYIQNDEILFSDIGILQDYDYETKTAKRLADNSLRISDLEGKQSGIIKENGEIIYVDSNYTIVYADEGFVVTYIYDDEEKNLDYYILKEDGTVELEVKAIMIYDDGYLVKMADGKVKLYDKKMNERTASYDKIIMNGEVDITSVL